MKAIVVVGHKSHYPNPISFRENDRVKVGEEDVENPSWVRVTTVDGNEGWAPKPYLSAEDESSVYSIAKVSYSAFELDTHKDEELTISKELNGWLWVKNISGVCGWVPANSVVRILK